MKQFFIIGVLILLGVVVFNKVSQASEYSRLKSEINRVSDITGINPDSIECRNVEFASICYAQYANLNSNSTKKMLTDADYTIVDIKYSRNGSVSATNESHNIRIDSDPITDNTVSLRFKDIDITL